MLFYSIKLVFITAHVCIHRSYIETDVRSSTVQISRRDTSDSAIILCSEAAWPPHSWSNKVTLSACLRQKDCPFLSCLSQPCPTPISTPFPLNHCALISVHLPNVTTVFFRLFLILFKCLKIGYNHFLPYPSQSFWHSITYTVGKEA